MNDACWSSDWEQSVTVTDVSVMMQFGSESNTQAKARRLGIPMLKHGGWDYRFLTNANDNLTEYYSEPCVLKVTATDATSHACSKLWPGLTKDKSVPFVGTAHKTLHLEAEK